MFNIVVPQLGESVVEARVARWLKKEGDPVNTGDPVVELETEKIDLEVGADHPGVIASIKHREGDDVKVGEVLAVVDDKTAPAPAPPAEPPRATPTARRVAREHDVDIANVQGSFNEVDMAAVMALRERRREEFKKQYGVGLGIVSFFLKATIAALRAVPQLNAEIQGDEIVLKHDYDIGIAVGAEGGLVVPVLRDADRMSFAEIELGIRDFAARAANGTLTIEDLAGGTFTITNGGVFGSLLSTPILNPPQVGILGLHTIQDRAVPVDGQVVIRPMMYVALTYDHRIVDGREAVQFLVKAKELVEDPANLLLVS